jgi:hypothetical protein
MADHLLFNSGSNESSLAPQFKWLDNTFKRLVAICHSLNFFYYVFVHDTDMTRRIKIIITWVMWVRSMLVLD